MKSCKHIRTTTFEYRVPGRYCEIETICLDCNTVIRKKYLTDQEYRDYVDQEKAFDELVRWAQEQGDYE